MTKRKKILFIVSRLPINTQTGDRLRVYHFIKQLHANGHQVDVLGFVPQGDYEVRTDIESITHQCIGIPKEGIEFENPSRSKQLKFFVESFPKHYPYRVWQWNDEKFISQARELIHYHNYDVIHYSEIVTALALYDEWIDFGNARLVFDLIDSVALSLDNALANDVSWLWPFRFIEKKRLKKFEQQTVRRVDHAILISDRDKKFLGDDDIKIIPNGVAENALPERNRDIDLLFTGNMAAEPNIDAADWFAREVLPLILKKKPELKFTIAGASPAERVRRLESKNVEVTGFVQDINEYYRRAKLFVCPMRLGAGQKNKILEAMINHAPVISTAEGNIGIDAPADAIAIADSKEDFSETVLGMLESDEKQERLADNGYTYAKASFSWERSAELLEQCYEG